MKRVFKLLTATALCMNLMVGISAAATIDGTTGPGSTNTITTDITNTTNINCTNNINLLNNNTQSANTGNTSSVGNTTAGNASSGDASNTSTSTATVNAGCGAQAANVPTPGVPASTTTIPSVLGTSTAAAPQVTVAPVGAVHAGGGAGASSSVAVAGLISSLGIIGFGALLRGRSFDW